MPREHKNEKVKEMGRWNQKCEKQPLAVTHPNNEAADPKGGDQFHPKYPHSPLQEKRLPFCPCKENQIEGPRQWVIP